MRLKIAQVCAVVSLVLLSGCEDMSEEDMGNFMQAMQTAANDGSGYNAGGGMPNYGEADPDQAFVNTMVQTMGGNPNGLGQPGGVSQQVSSTGGADPSTPGQPNMAAQYCPGFTEDNYRTRAYQGGNDTQLFTMCGAAYEYYHMYQNAIRQGLAGADRTYAAHKGAAEQVRQFAQEAR